MTNLSGDSVYSKDIIESKSTIVTTSFIMSSPRTIEYSLGYLYSHISY